MIRRPITTSIIILAVTCLLHAYAWAEPASNFSRVESVEFVDGALKINCSLPVACTTGDWNGKVWVDIQNAVLATEVKEIYVGSDTVQRARLGQYDATTVRVTLDLAKPAGYCIESPLPAQQVVLRVTEPLTITPPPESAVQTPPSSKPSNHAGAKQFTVNRVRVESISENAFQVVVETSAKAQAYVDYGAMPPQIVLGLPGASLGAAFAGATGSHQLMKAIRCRNSTKGVGVRVEIDLTRVIAYSLNVSGSAITLQLRLPDKAGGSLADKLIVIDPGHGGDDAGARYCGVMEKSVNLQMACELAEALEREGARTIVTRGEAYISLDSRPRIAIDNNADFFISLHCNACEVLNKASGIECYYYKDEPDSRQPLAYAIQASVCLHTGMKSRYVKGRNLAVLRGLANTGIPGVLLECGYLNHSSDRAKLVAPEYRAQLIAGIIGGLRAYIDGAPISL